MFRDTACLDRLFPTLARHGLVIRDSDDGMRFLGRMDAKAALPGRLPGQLDPALVSPVVNQEEGEQSQHDKD